MCESTGCDQKEVFNHYIYALMKVALRERCVVQTGDIKSARTVALDASHSLGFNGESCGFRGDGE